MEKEWWKSELANDIHEVLRKKELTLVHYMASSPQLSLRRYLVDWLAIIFEKMGCSYGILHLSVCLMDFFMDNHDIPEPQLHLVALTCFLLAGSCTSHVLTSLHLEEIEQLHQINIPRKRLIQQDNYALGFINT